MRFFLVLLVLSLSQTGFSQNKNVSIFHRLLVYNSNNELLIVKFKDTDIWVTPGFYQDSTQFIQSGLHKTASDYGITISNPTLKGVFSYRSEQNDQTSISVRNIYSSNYINGQIKVPSFLGEVKWVPFQEAMETLTYPHINLFIKQTYEFPNVVWGGSLIRSRDGDQWETKIIEEFYPIFSIEKPKLDNGRDSITIDDLKVFSYDFSLENGLLQGAGATVLNTAIAGAQYTMLGDNIGSKLEQIFTEALIPVLDKHNYKNMVLEVGLGTGSTINKLAEEGEQISEKIKTVNQKYALRKKGRIFTPILEFKSEEGTQFFQSAANLDWTFLTLGVAPWTSYKMLTDELYANLISTNQKKYQSLFEQTQTILDRQNEKIQAHNSEEVKVFIEGLKSTTTLQEFLNKMRICSANIEIIEGFQYSMDYWEMYGNREFYKKNMVSAKKDKVRLMQELKRVKFDVGKDKLFVKMWRNHLGKGHALSGAYGVGNMLLEMAESNGNESLTIGFIERYSIKEGSIHDILDTKDVFSKRYRDFVQLGKKEDWVLIDLRPFNKEFYYGPYAMSEGIYKMLARFDMLIIPKADVPATPNY